MAEFKYKLCDICISPRTSVEVCCVPCLTARNIAISTDESEMLYLLLPLIVPLHSVAIIQRNRVRRVRNIIGSDFEDLAIGLCCPWCSMVQCHNEFMLTIKR
ncbi:hypothetical protein RF11_08508 [Thelohanellus kitauei]|uniref:Uncharacterized protein n=1 Tax=Thelohanellus kitauei TaxID=669202 RepID=A0A0C2NDD8_THEKT|nr:hypothetical protein RF11_08508 [Thelohanellus kitauei]